MEITNRWHGVTSNLKQRTLFHSRFWDLELEMKLKFTSIWKEDSKPSSDIIRFWFTFFPTQLCINICLTAAFCEQPACLAVRHDWSAVYLILLGYNVKFLFLKLTFISLIHSLRNSTLVSISCWLLSTTLLGICTWSISLCWILKNTSFIFWVELVTEAFSIS